MLQIIAALVIYIALVIPMGTYLYHIASGQKTFADPVFNRIDNGIYKICGINRQGMNWKQYVASLLTTNAVMIFAGYLILRIQGTPALCGRVGTFLFESDAGHHFYDVYIRCHRICGLHGFYPRHHGKRNTSGKFS